MCRQYTAVSCLRSGRWVTVISIAQILHSCGDTKMSQDHYEFTDDLWRLNKCLKYLKGRKEVGISVFLSDPAPSDYLYRCIIQTNKYQSAAVTTLGTEAVKAATHKRRITTTVYHPVLPAKALDFAIDWGHLYQTSPSWTVHSRATETKRIIRVDRLVDENRIGSLS